MANMPGRFTQKDVERALKGALACGLSVKRTVVRADGAIQLDYGSADVDDSELTPLQKRNKRKNADET